MSHVFFLLQKSLTSLELPGASLHILTNPASSLNFPRPDRVSYEGSSSTSDYDGRLKQKVHDPAHDISIQVLEKFSLLTKFARETTSHIFREGQNGLNAYEQKRKRDRLQLNEITPVVEQMTSEENAENSVPVEVTPYIPFNC